MIDPNFFPKPQKPCPGCGGSGQTAFFGGESRFMLTWEDCPDCAGTGVVLATTTLPLPSDNNEDES